MKPLRLVAGIVGVVVLIIIGGGIAAILAYLNGDTSVLGSLGNLLVDSFDYSWILGLAILGLLILFLSMIYTGLRRSTK